MRTLALTIAAVLRRERPAEQCSSLVYHAFQAVV